MTRAYNNNKRTSPQRGSAPQQFLIVVVSFLLGYLTACVFDFDSISHWMNKQMLAQQEVKKSPKIAPRPQEQTPTKVKPKFEFYTLLANEKKNPSSPPNTRAVEHPSPASTQIRRIDVNTAKNSSIAKNNNALNPPPQIAVKVVESKPIPLSSLQNHMGSYLVQVAAFKLRTDAEHMKGLLILKGFNVQVASVSRPQGVWFRVLVGPYSNKNLAQKAQFALAKNERLRGMIVSG